MDSKILTTAVLLATAGFFTSCLEEDVFVVDSLSHQTIVAQMDEPAESHQTRTCVDVKNPNTSFIGLLWQPDDQIGVYSQDGEVRNVLFTSEATTNVPQAEFSGDMSGTPYYAYYPYSADNDGCGLTAINGTVLTEQTFDPESGTLVCDYKYGTRSSDGTNTFNFKQLFTMLRITLDASETALEGERLNNIVLKITDASGNQRPICGDFTFSAVDGDWNAAGNTSGSVSMPWTTRPALVKGKTYLGFITVMPVVKAGDKITIEVITEGHKASFTADSKVDFLSGFVYNIPLKLKEYAENGKFGYSEQAIPRPTIESFKFEYSNNTGKLLEKKLGWSSKAPSTSTASYVATIEGEEIKLTIPYLYDFKLKPTFTAGGTVTVNGKEITSGETEVDFTKPVVFTVTLDGGGSRDYTVKITNTGLPVVVINQSKTGDFTKVSKDWLAGLSGKYRNKFVDFWIRGKDTDWVEDDQITVYNPDGTIDCSVKGGVRLRGNTTQDYPKKPLAMKFTDKKSVLGMPEHKRWVLLANWLDHSMIRNTVALDIAHAIEYAWRNDTSIGEGIPWTVHGQNVELVIISQKDSKAYHVGNYFLCEQIKIDKNRVNITEPDGADVGTDYTQYGYLFEVDNNLDEDSQFETTNGVPFMFKDKVSSTILNDVKSKVQAIETNLYKGNDAGYAAAFENLDINSVVDQWLIWEITLNREYGDPRSVYMYMDGAGMLKAGSVWDFDRGTFQNQENAKSYGNSDRLKPVDEWMCWRESDDDNYIWYKALIKSATFQAKVKERWAVVKPYLDMIPDQIRYYGETQAVSYSYDSAMWPTNKADVQAWKSGFSDWSGDEQISDWNEVINNFVTVYKARLAGMDALITSGTFTK